MAALDTLFRKLTKSVLASLGVDGIIFRETETYDPVTGDNVSASVNTTVRASPPSDYTYQYKEASLQLGTTAWVIVGALGLAIEPDPKTDRYLFDGFDFKVVRADPIYSGDEVAAYVLHLKE